MPTSSPVEVTLRGVDQAGDAEVGELRAAALPEQDVGRLHVAVHQPLGVHVVEGLGDGLADLPDLLERQRAALEGGGQRLAVDELHDDPRPTGVVGAGVVDLHQRGVRQPGERLGLVGRAGGRLVVRDGHELQRDDAVERGVGRLPDLGGAAAAAQHVEAVAVGDDRSGGHGLRSGPRSDRSPARHQLGDLDGVEGSALAQVVVAHEQRHAPWAVLPHPSDVRRDRGRPPGAGWGCR